MPQTKPYHRIFRKIKESPNSGFSGWAYIIDREYARDPQHYVRAYLLIQSDLQKLFEYVEPSDLSATSYSFRIHELLMRTCIEIEANFKAILAANGYKPRVNGSGRELLNIHVYKKINVSHHLSDYEVMLPIWGDGEKIFKPFSEWNNGTELSWYRAYNASKHDRHEAFKSANLLNLITAVAGLLALMSSQFRDESFSAAASAIGDSGYDYHEMEAALGGLFRIKYPDNWSDEDIYDFDWNELKKLDDRFSKFDYNSI